MATGSGLRRRWHWKVVLLFHHCSVFLANDVKASYGGPSHLRKCERQFNGLFDVYKKTLKSDGIARLCRGFGVSCIGCIFVHGLSVGLHDALKPLFDRRSGSKVCQVSGTFTRF